MTQQPAAGERRVKLLAFLENARANHPIRFDDDFDNGRYSGYLRGIEDSLDVIGEDASDAAPAAAAEQLRLHAKSPDFIRWLRFMTKVQLLLGEVYGERDVTPASSTLHVHYLDQVIKEYCSNEPLAAQPQGGRS